mgnify:CR=1 FL=1
MQRAVGGGGVQSGREGETGLDGEDAIGLPAADDLIDEAASRIKMEIDSKPESMDKLDRRLIQLKIEREAVKKETDEASRKRLELIEAEITRLEKEYADLEEIWKSEKAAVQGSQHVKEELEKLKVEMEAAKRKGDWQKVSELQYGRIPQLEAQLKSEGKGEAKPKQKPRLLRTEVGAEEIAEVVSRATGIPWWRSSSSCRPTRST